MEKHIVVFDSGLWGLTVLKLLQKELNENYIYFADKKNIPYWTKNKKELKKIIKNSINTIPEEKIKMLVIACNTATSVCVEDLRKEKSFPIIWMEPAIKPALQNSKDKKTLITATSTTLKEEKLKNLIQQIWAPQKTEKISLNKLVLYAEKLNFTGKDVEKYLEDKFKNINFQEYQNIVLWCTHFIYYKNIIKKIAQKENESIEIIDWNQGTVNQCIKVYKKFNFSNSQRERNIKYLNNWKERINAKKMNEIIYKKL